MKEKKLTRGERNHNPMNVRLDENNHWRGKIKGSDKEFETFTDDVYGIRAGIKILHTYYHKYGLKSIQRIIQRYAPSSENDTYVYIMVVCGIAKLEPYEVFEWNCKNVTNIVKGMIKMEIGKVYSDRLIEQAYFSAN